ncbi:hypothetical protein F511_04479 [Dorcoceras hygrometricum]|uniref:Uncharacterized protein n=1 Tax=Dorcoceras hygrometricum TaxID=472368 RepID=A0A2Z7C8T2_9LAMI|nr:hypothetical protein F511_04479 [Dorcoceras hygrometricum]
MQRLDLIFFSPVDWYNAASSFSFVPVDWFIFLSDCCVWNSSLCFCIIASSVQRLIIVRKFCRETMAAEEATPMALNYIPEVVLKKRKNNEESAIRRKLQLQERVKRRKSEKFAIKKPEQFIREFRDKVKILALIDW